MDYSLICMDIDGTLVSDKQYIPDNVIQSIKKADSLGIKIALISGRYPTGVRLAEKQLGVECINVSYAGGYIFNKFKCLHCVDMSLETGLMVYDIAREKGGDCWFFCGEHWFVTEMNEWVRYEENIVKAKPELITLDKIDAMLKNGDISLNKVLVTGENETIKNICKIADNYNTDVKFGYSSDRYLEVLPSKVNKGMALEKICEINNIPLSKTIVFGDQDLDIPMIKIAGMGVAMGNGIDELKENADFVTKSNNEGGIAYALKKILNI